MDVDSAREAELRSIAYLETTTTPKRLAVLRRVIMLKNDHQELNRESKINMSLNQRSRIMASVPAQNTKPELMVRSALHGAGYRFRVHRKDLPGRPDIVLPRYRTVVFVHGCFWHQHPGCRKSTIPKTNSAYWNQKLKKNVERDRTNRLKLLAMGWKVVIVWECEIYASLKKTVLKIDKYIRHDIYQGEL